MCLYLNKNFKKETERFRKSSNILIGYKVLQKVDGQNFESVYKNFPYKLNKITKSNRNSIDLFDYEIECFAIDYGFHFFKNLKDVKKELSYWKNNYHYRKYIIGKFEILPENLVAVGTFEGYKNFVAKKAELTKIVGKKPTLTKENEMKTYSTLNKTQKEMVQALLSMDYTTSEVSSLTGLPKRSLGVAKGNMKRYGRKTYNEHQAS